MTEALVARAPIIYPCDYIDKGGLAVTDNARGCSGTPTWQLVVRGALDPAHVRAALADVATRYPSLRCRVHALDDADPLRARRFAYVEDPAFAVDAIFRAVDARSEAALEALAHAERNRPLDLFTDFPVTLTLARTADDACQFFFRQHHSIADGRAFIALLADFAAFLDAARAGRRPSPDSLAPIGRQ
ncbi:MAG TPA: condensation domain-containing protein, partial [Polyangia bacterium]